MATSVPQFQEMRVRETHIRVMRAGRGEPLVILRGIDASDGWRDYMTALARNHDVIVPEHPGFGGADKPDWLDTVGDLANFYLDFLDALDVSRVHLVGAGLGGWVAADLATRNTRRLASLTLCAPAGLLIDGVETPDFYLRSEEDNIRDAFVDQTLAEAEIARALTAETEDVRLTNQVVIAQLTWSPRWHDPKLATWLHRIDVPTHLVWGAQDGVTPQAYAQVWKRLILGARLSVIDKAGHAALLERPAQCVDAMNAFFEGASIKEGSPA